jgi:hypothetical protein
MGRSGYSDDYCEGHELWRGAVEAALSGRRGQAFLREMLRALDALPQKRLIDEALVDADGEVCALGAVSRLRALAVAGVDTENRDQLSELFGIAPAMAAEIMYINDEGARWGEAETPEARFTRVRSWVVSEIHVRAEELEAAS